jgi:hypothetical protein
MADDTIDQAPPQSIEDKVMSRFGFPSQQTDATAADDSALADDGFADLDWEGQTLKIPKGLKDAFMRNEDYTKKTQSLADERRAVEHVREIAQQAQLSQAFAESVAAEQQQLHVIDAYLQQATKVDWSTMTTDQMLRHKVDIDNIKEQRADLMKALNEKRTKFNDEFNGKVKDLRGKARELASKSIQGFSEQTETEMRKFANSEGLTDSEIDNVFLDPRSYKVIYKAMQFDKIQAGTGKAAEAATKAERVLKPGAAGERMPQGTRAQLEFGKAMKAARTSGEKANIIEDRLANSMFSRGHK